jgi:hypothetical protein
LIAIPAASSTETRGYFPVARKTWKSPAWFQEGGQKFSGYWRRQRSDARAQKKRATCIQVAWQ